jgi:hypothetical protein
MIGKRPESCRCEHRGEWTDLEFGTLRKPIRRQSQRNPTRLGCDELECDTCLATLYNTFATVYDTSQNDPTQLVRRRVRHIATEI